MQNQWVQLAIWFVLFIGIFYVFIILPRKKQDKKHQDMVSSLKRGEKVVTIGGMKGEIAKVKENTVMLRVSDGVEIEMLKKAIAYKDGEE